MKRYVLGGIAVLTAAMLSGCGGQKDKGSVYYLNFKPEAADTWEEIAKAYTEETGVEVKVLTSASGNYEQTLKAEIAKREMPTIFQINGPVGYGTWKNYCEDLKDSNLYSWLLDKEMAVTGEDGGVYGIPYVVEGYGIIYNDAIMKKYFALPDKAVSINSTEEIKNFDTLQTVAKDMTKHKEKLGIEGVFASTSFSSGEDWRWQTHLANLPVYYEFRDKGITDSDTLDFTYEQNYHNIFDLYTDYSCTEKTALARKTVNDSMEEFALGKAAMVQNGNWAWGQISSIEGNVVTVDDVKFLPIYTGVSGEENQSICTGTENYICINAMADEKDKKASLDFIEWVFSSEKGKDYVTNSLGFISPFDTFSEEESPNDPLAKQVIAYMSNESLTNVNWNFTAFPSQKFKDDFGAALLGYCQGKYTWDKVISQTTADWHSEKTGE